MPFYIVITEENYWQQRYLTRLKQNLGGVHPEHCHVLQSPSVTDLELYCGGQSLLTWLIDDAQRPPEVTRLLGWQVLNKAPLPKEQSLLQAILSDLPSHKHLVCLTDKFDQRSTWAKSLAALAHEVYTPQLPPPWKEDAWLVLIQEEITASCGLTVSSQVAHWLLSHVGPTLGEIVQRVQTARLLMAEGDSHLTLDHLQALIPRSYYQTFELVDSWIRYHFSVRPSSEASLAWASLIAYVKQEPALKLMALFRHRLQELYGIVLDKSHGLSEETIGQKIGKHPFIIKKTLQQFQNTTHEGLQALLHHLVSLEWQAKEGILTPELALEVFLAQRPAANCTLLKESIFTWEQAYHVMPTEAFKIQPSL